MEHGISPHKFKLAVSGCPRNCAEATIKDFGVVGLGAKVVQSKEGDIAIFRTSDDKVFALADKCPHKEGPLSQGIVHGHTVTCPLHNWRINLADG